MLFAPPHHMWHDDIHDVLTLHDLHSHTLQGGVPQHGLLPLFL